MICLFNLYNYVYFLLDYISIYFELNINLMINYLLVIIINVMLFMIIRGGNNIF